MQTFEFYKDVKVTQWYREFHFLEAETLEDAKKIMIENFQLGATDNTFSYQDALFDTIQDMTYKENGDNPTQELYYNDELLSNKIGRAHV